MTLQREDIDINSTIANGINHAVLISDAPAPLTLKVALQGFRLAKTGERMLLNVLKQFRYALHDFHVSCLLPVIVIFSGFLEQNYFHRSSMAIGWKLPFLISSSPWRTMSSSSARDILLSSLYFFAAIRLSERTAFFISPSSLAMVCRAPKSSALSCICSAVITSENLNYACKTTKKN